MFNVNTLMFKYFITEIKYYGLARVKVINSIHGNCINIFQTAIKLLMQTV